MPPICPNLLQTGSCQDANCTQRHDVHICTICNLTSSTEELHRVHLRSKRHLRASNGSSQQLYCPVCKTVIPGLNDWQSHVGGRRHAVAAQQQGVSPEVEPEEPGAAVLSHMFCAVCKIYMHEDAWPRHPQTKLHSRKLLAGAIQVALDEASKDKHGVSISPQDLDFGVLEVSEATTGASLTVDITTTVPSSRYHLVEAKLPLRAHDRVSP